MKINFRHIVLAISLVLSVSALYAESFDGMFGVRHIDRTDGLSSERVFSIVEDNDNVMWISTRTGVDRYNGRTVKIMHCLLITITVIWQEESPGFTLMTNWDFWHTTIPDEYININRIRTVLNCICFWANILRRNHSY